ncbi:MAG: 16S rRNA (adenine(1518)-N(6)/adenine(1519)-N(6))-dimethyltransferase RsmA [Myxococcota bacterium]|nr:16S rRNA (adenine(1518)-N(6)/adenine(1519)-N(6))-dimethyltransferase RsmA [Myxococcota bacterium]
MGTAFPRFEDPRAVLKRYGLSPKRSWGQNFLISERAVNTIATHSVDVPGRRIAEIGAGIGTLTGALLRSGATVTAIERDRDMCAVLRSEFGSIDRFEVAEADAKSFDYAAWLAVGPGIVVGNLPYQITGPLLRIIMDLGPTLMRSILMIQEEVADRITAPPGTKTRGALSVMLQARCHPKILARLGPSAFYPVPKVRSAVLALDPKPSTCFDDGLQKSTFDRVVRAAFSSRRKFLKNALIAAQIGSRSTIEAILSAANIDPKVRAETLTLEQFVDLARNF